MPEERLQAALYYIVSSALVTAKGIIEDHKLTHDPIILMLTALDPVAISVVSLSGLPKEEWFKAVSLAANLANAKGYVIVSEAWGTSVSTDGPIHELPTEDRTDILVFVGVARGDTAEAFSRVYEIATTPEGRHVADTFTEGEVEFSRFPSDW
jgi:hypothetical protein